MGVIIDYVEMMTHILSKLTEEYKNIVENIQDYLDEDIDPLTIERIRDKLSVEYDQMAVKSETKTSIEDEKSLYVKYKFKGTFNKCGTYGHKSINCMERKENNYSTYFKKYGHMIQ